MSKLQNAFSSFTQDYIVGQKKKDEEVCSYRTKQARSRKTIIINCRECNYNSSLNDMHCRSNILGILQKEANADCLVLSRLYERDYEGEALTLLYLLASFCGIITSYRSVEKVPEACKMIEKKGCDLERKEVLAHFIEIAEVDPLKARLEIRKFIHENKLEGTKNIHADCIVCSKCFYHILHDIEDKFTHFPDIPALNSDEFFDYESVLKSHVRPPFSSSRICIEAPENTEFLECYDINGREGRKLEVTIYRYNDRPEKFYMIRPPEYNLRQEELILLDKVRRRMIRYRPKDLAFAEPAYAREYFRRMAEELLEEELLTDGKTCNPEELEGYADLLARYTYGLGIVEDLLSDIRITDVYINAPADTNPVHVVVDGEECASNVFLSQDDLDALVSRFRAISGRPFGEAVPVLELNLEAFGVRVSVIGDPLSANGLAYAFRKHSLSPWTLPKLINSGSISPLAAGLLSFLMDGQASVLVAGEVGAGKTSLLSAMLLEIPQKYRILTIEDTQELPIEKLQSLGWKVQAMSSQSSVLKSGAEMSPETALRAALRLGSSSLVLGEVRGPEVKVLYEAMQVGKAGNSVIGTIHGSSVEDVYERIVHTLGVPQASFKTTDAVIICSAIRLEGSMKKIKRVSRIAEVENIQIENPEPAEIFTDIMHYDASQDCLLAGKAFEQGQSELIGKIACKWGISIDRALKSIEIRTKIKEKIAIEGLHKPFLLEADAVSQINNMFWLLTDSMVQSKEYSKDCEDKYKSDLESSSCGDLETLYRQWETWFENFSNAMENKKVFEGEIWQKKATGI
jgi:type IV secretory pathway ATPase VirB11/archaellum biosynthesis ATPase